MTDRQGLGERLRRERLRLNLSQEELAEAIDVSARSVRRWERDESVPQPFYRARCCRLFGLDPEALFGEETEQQSLEPFPICQLPPATGDLTGRDQPLTDLHRLLEAGRRHDANAIPIVVVTGRAGVGKTALAVRAAHDLRPHFPDGQLYVSLSEGGQPVDPGRLLEQLLRTLGVGGTALPDSLQERAQLYRARLARRQVLVVLDDAASEAEVRPLLPGVQGCAVLVTSRSRLAGIEGASRLELELLSRDQATELLSRVSGRQRVEAEPAAAVEIVERCGRLPLALRVAAARLAARPHWSLARMSERLGREHRRLDELSLGDLDVRASLMLSYRALSRPEQRTFRLLGLVEAADVASWGVGALLDVDPGTAEELLEGLVDARLVDVAGRDAAGQTRYRLHDLLRMLARERAQTEERLGEEQAAAGRLVAACLACALAAEARMPGLHALWCEEEDGPRKPHRTELLPDDSLDWFRAEHGGIVAAISMACALDLNDLACNLACAVSPYFMLEGHFDDWERVQELAVQAAQRGGNRRGEAYVRHWFGDYLRQRGRPLAATEEFERSLRLFVEAGDRRGEAYGLHGLGAALHGAGRIEEGRVRLQQSHRLFRELGDGYGQAVALFELGYCELSGGRHEEAAGLLERSIERLGSMADAGRPGPRSWCRTWCRRSEGYAIACLAGVHEARGDLDGAVDCLQRAAAIFREIADRFGHALAMLQLGVIHRKRGSGDLAMPCLQSARRALARLAMRQQAAIAEYELGRLHQDLQLTEEALSHYRRSQAEFADLGLREREAKARYHIADILGPTGTDSVRLPPRPAD